MNSLKLVNKKHSSLLHCRLLAVVEAIVLGLFYIKYLISIKAQYL